MACTHFRLALRLHKFRQFNCPDIAFSTPLAIVTSAGTLDGQFVEPIVVTTPFNKCARGTAQQTPSTRCVLFFLCVCVVCVCGASVFLEKCE